MSDQNKVFDKKKKSSRRNSILKPTSLSREPLQVSLLSRRENSGLSNPFSLDFHDIFSSFRKLQIAQT